jgi:hypothetical protein
MKGDYEMTDEELLAPLRQEPPGVPTIDVRRAMAEGLRHRRRHFWTGGIASVAVVALLGGGGVLAAASMNGEPKPAPKPTPVSLPTTCKVSVLPYPPGMRSQVDGGDPSGHYLVGDYFGHDGVPKPLIWKDGFILAHPTIPGGTLSDINSHGEAVAAGWDPPGQNHGYVYKDGRVTKLKGGLSRTQVINDEGVVAGTLGDVIHGVPARWASSIAEPEKLPLPPGMKAGQVTGIAEDGTILGTVSSDARANAESGILWFPDGTYRLLRLAAAADQGARIFVPQSKTGDLIFGVEQVIDKARQETDSQMRYNVTTNSYESMSRPASELDRMPIADGRSVGTIGNGESNLPAMFAGPKELRLPVNGNQPRHYSMASLSDDGQVVGGTTSSLSGDAKLSDEPLMWICH